MNTYNPHHVETPVYFRAGVKVLLTDDENRLLLLKRSDKSSTAGQWELPGGGIEAGEHPFKAAEREVTEETGLQMRDLKLLAAATVRTKKGEETIIMGYAAVAETTDITLSWEHDEYAWITKNETGQYHLPGLHRYMVDTYYSQIM